MDESFAQAYPQLTRWVMMQGWIEMGDDPMQRSRLRVLDEGGLIWAGGDATSSIDAVLREAENFIARLVADEQEGQS